jgi:hypothetical protein
VSLAQRRNRIGSAEDGRRHHLDCERGVRIRAPRVAARGAADAPLEEPRGTRLRASASARSALAPEQQRLQECSPRGRVSGCTGVTCHRRFCEVCLSCLAQGRQRRSCFQACESGDRERQRSEAGSERPPVPMQDAGTGPAAALLLLVQGDARSRPATHSPRPLMRASCGVPVVAPDRAVHRAGLTGHATTSGRQEGRSSGTTPARGSRYATIWELNE